jgi:prevent-host-death family protein
MIDQCLTNLTK